MRKNDIRRFRLARGLTLQDLASRAGISTERLGRLEISGATPDAHRRWAIANALKVRMDAVFPEVARVAKELRHGKPYPVQAYTYDDLIWLANVQVGDRLIVKRSVGDTRLGFRLGDPPSECTVVETSKYWFRVRLDKSGAYECYSYHAMIEPDTRFQRRETHADSYQPL